MINFFRKIRQKMLTNNKVSKYLMYAIGEIVLVVIGILIALQINNWNENQKIRKQETIYIQNLKNDLNTQIKTLNFYIDFQDLIIQNSNIIIAHFNKNKGFYNMDSIYPRLNDLSIRTTFINNNSTLTEMINSGEINILSNQTLKKDLLDFNQQVVTFMKITQNNNTNLIDLLIVPNLIKSSNFASSGYTKAMRTFLKASHRKNEINYVKNNDVENFLNEPKERNELINNVAYRYEMAQIQKSGNEDLKAKAEYILADIIKELDNN